MAFHPLGCGATTSRLVPVAPQKNKMTKAIINFSKVPKTVYRRHRRKVALYKFIEEWQAAHGGKSPSYSQIMQEFRFPDNGKPFPSKSVVYHYMNFLILDGWAVIKRRHISETGNIELKPLLW